MSISKLWASIFFCHYGEISDVGS